jgi:hypothetical protein
MKSSKNEQTLISPDTNLDCGKLIILMSNEGKHEAEQFVNVKDGKVIGRE